MHTSSLGCLLVLSSVPPLSHSPIPPALGMALPTVCRVFLHQLSLLRQCPNSMPTGQPSVNNPTLRLSLLGRVKMAMETVAGDDKRKIISVYFFIYIQHIPLFHKPLSSQVTAYSFLV